LALLPLLAHAVAVGSDALVATLRDGLATQAGRRLPLPPRRLGWAIELGCVVIAALGSLIAGLRLRLPAVGLLSILVLPQAFVRAEPMHFAAAGALPIALLPLTVRAALDALPAPLPRPRRAALASVLAIAIVAICVPRAFARAGVDAVRLADPSTVSTYAVERSGRRIAFGSRRVAAEVKALIAAVDRTAAPGDRLFVGPKDLRRTNDNDSFLYYLFPDLVPATFYIEMTPGAASRPGSRLARDVASADVLILTSRYDGFAEPNASRDFGSAEPARVVSRDFVVVAATGPYEVYVRRDREATVP
ncbi:MAG TPA: hypothetical protein VJQ09_07755, partial [Candidatus Limnocylindria bacterium]|nr:hypothetical protein [Candidatus Limnocylindria bacterium]